MELIQWELSLPMTGGWNDVVLKVPSNPNHSKFLWYDSIILVVKIQKNSKHNYAFCFVFVFFFNLCYDPFLIYLPLFLLFYIFRIVLLPKRKGSTNSFCLDTDICQVTITLFFPASGRSHQEAGCVSQTRSHLRIRGMLLLIASPSKVQIFKGQEILPVLLDRRKNKTKQNKTPTSRQKINISTQKTRQKKKKKDLHGVGLLSTIHLVMSPR